MASKTGSAELPYVPSRALDSTSVPRGKMMGRTDGEDMLGPTLGVRLELFPDARPAQRRDRHSDAPRAIGCAGTDKEHSQQLVVEAPLCLQWVAGLSLGLMDMLPDTLCPRA